ncbi:PRTRC system ThiF family protein [Acidithiobacillus caldus ATCC 51756]|jgi:PRTRC genetic system ThiF family protein|uniref:PRTRC system ThiF family protein n=1 Tax=Acidithiobacillus caldus TaxID=33059 RepID=UPI001C06832F|nr:PRTRC system ThiF family protein [Acidithiobacillus caldus]MBU2736356.1 PRTRC system ThiF family protein [Acidithiobacillus caldus ATCC 51756]MBU2802509.1 PRTRC system ThiF family protein [Acidithiobacillus caldus]
MIRHVVQLPTQGALRIAVIGAGGNGAQMASGLAQIAVAQRSFGAQPLAVTIFDDDLVSEANVGRQLFSPSDVGRPKADVLVERINAFYGFSWISHPARVGPENWPGVPRSFHEHFHLFIGAVDSAASRVAIGEVARAAAFNALYWLDLGNRERSGQVVIGAYRQHKVILPTVLDLYPELSDPNFSEQDQGPSCSLAEALYKQDLFVNRDVTTPALHLLWELLHKRVLETQGCITNLETLRRMPLPVDPALWSRMNPNLALDEPLKYLQGLPEQAA